MPLGLNATLFTQSSWRIGCPICSPVAAFHSRTVVSAEPEAMRVPSGLNATLFTQSSWRIGCPIGCPVVVSHKRTVLSAPPVAMRVPSGLNATLITVSSWRSRLPDRLPGGGVPQPNRRVVAPPEAMRVPSGLNATLVTASSWRSGSPTGCPGRCVPQPDRAVGTAGGDTGAVRTVRHARHHLWNVDHLHQVPLLIQSRKQWIRCAAVSGRYRQCGQQLLHAEHVVDASRSQPGQQRLRLRNQPQRGRIAKRGIGLIASLHRDYRQDDRQRLSLLPVRLTAT